MGYEKVTMEAVQEFKCVNDTLEPQNPIIPELHECYAANATSCGDGQSCYFKASAIAYECSGDSYTGCYCAKDSFILFNRMFIGVYMASFFGALGLVGSLAKLSKVSTVSFLCLFTSLTLIMIELIRADAPDASDSASESGGVVDTFLV